MHCQFVLTVSVLEEPARCTKAGAGTSWGPTHPTTTTVVWASASSEISEVRDLTDYKELSPSAEAASYTVTQEFPNIL
jgi:hypothetical protein